MHVLSGTHESLELASTCLRSSELDACLEWNTCL